MLLVRKSTPQLHQVLTVLYLPVALILFLLHYLSALVLYVMSVKFYNFFPWITLFFQVGAIRKGQLVNQETRVCFQRVWVIRANSVQTDMNYCFNFYDQRNVLLRYTAWRSVIEQPPSQGSFLPAP